VVPSVSRDGVGRQSQAAGHGRGRLAGSRGGDELGVAFGRPWPWSAAGRQAERDPTGVDRALGPAVKSREVV
jgi:hypothetical protein